MEGIKSGFRKLALLVSTLYCCASHIQASDGKPDGAQNTAPLNPQAIVQQMDKDERALFDRVKKGVVAVKVVSYASDSNPDGSENWSGSGFFVHIGKEKSYLLTNAHVAGRMEVCTYELKLANGQKIEARRAYVDPIFDFAIMEIDSKDIPEDTVALPLSKENVLLNMTIYAMGNTENNEFSVYKGYIFDDQTSQGMHLVAEQSILFSGLTGPGASGSPLFNQAGEVVGLLYGGSWNGVWGCALPLIYIRPALDALISGKSFNRHIIGADLNYVNIKELKAVDWINDEQIKEYNNEFPQSKKVAQVLTVFPRFNKTGEFEPGDIIWKANGKLIGPNIKNIDAIMQDHPNEIMKFEVLRAGKLVNLDILPKPTDSSAKNRILSFSGTTLFELTDDTRITYAEESKGVYIKRGESSSLFKRVFSPREEDRWWFYGFNKLISIDGKEVKSLNDVIDMIPALLKKKDVVIKFQNMQSKSNTPSIVIASHRPEFAKAMLYEFDENTNSWNPQDVKEGKIKKTEQAKANEEQQNIENKAAIEGKQNS